ncbi:unnamed protein product [Arctogadus glacialis]
MWSSMWALQPVRTAFTCHTFGDGVVAGASTTLWRTSELAHHLTIDQAAKYDPRQLSSPPPLCEEAGVSLCHDRGADCHSVTNLTDEMTTGHAPRHGVMLRGWARFAHKFFTSPAVPVTAGAWRLTAKGQSLSLWRMDSQLTPGAAWDNMDGEAEARRTGSRQRHWTSKPHKASGQSDIQRSVQAAVSRRGVSVLRPSLLSHHVCGQGVMPWVALGRRSRDVVRRCGRVFEVRGRSRGAFWPVANRTTDQANIVGEGGVAGANDVSQANVEGVENVAASTGMVNQGEYGGMEQGGQGGEGY